MATAIESLPITETREPADQQELVDVVRSCYEEETPIYIIGGGTSLDFGRPAKKEGVGLSLARLNRVVDYPARDMTITLEAGVTMQQLALALAKENQQLPIDVPQAEQATIGGVVATNFNGPRRYGLGSMRDYVIGINAIDGCGMAFKGGGRVVKNVAGYDFCKLLTGSLGTLGVISQLTLRLQPIAEQSSLAVCSPADLDEAEKLLAALSHSDTTPVAVELLTGPSWVADPTLSQGLTDREPTNLHLVVGFEGTAIEVDWMLARIAEQWKEQGITRHDTIKGSTAVDFWRRLAEFPAVDAPLVLKASVRPSGTTKVIAAAREIDPQCSIQAHAGNGVVIVRLAEFPSQGLARTVIGNLQSVAANQDGNVVILSNPGRSEMTHQSTWGHLDTPLTLMNALKEKFDPKDLLNPDRFVYA